MDWSDWVAMATSIILSTVKNPQRKAKVERAMYKIYTSLLVSYPKFSDPNYTPPQ